MKKFLSPIMVLTSLFWVWSAGSTNQPDISRAASDIDLQTAELTPTPTYDPLKEPELPENPSEIEYGEYLYYYHCMPCHGDLGQGLTDEFRQVWVEDHQNCWARGCHGGKPRDEGFPIPTYIPGVISEDDALPGFISINDLNTYMHQTHPPQYPGGLADDEYHALTAYLWARNNKPVNDPPDTPIPTNAPSLKAENLAFEAQTPVPDQEPIKTSLPIGTQSIDFEDHQQEISTVSTVEISNSLFALLGGGLIFCLLIFLLFRIFRRGSV